MKRLSLLLVIVIFASYSFTVFAQKTKDKEQKKNIEPKPVSKVEKTYLSKDSAFIFSDAILKSIVPTSIPEGWLFYVKDNQIIIEKKDSVYVLAENRMNAPTQNLTKEQRDERIMQYGTKTKAYIAYTFQPKWTVQQLEQATISNANVYNNLQELAKKYGIAASSGRGSGGDEKYVAKNETDQKKYDEYLTKKTELEKQIIRMPNYHTTNYSLFLDKMYGCYDDYHSVFPDQTSVDLYHIELLFREICGK